MVSRIAVLSTLGATLLAAGCSLVLDGYQTACPNTSVTGDDGSCLPIPACADIEVPVAGGGCEPAGVIDPDTGAPACGAGAASRDVIGFRSDELGGCLSRLPDEPCPDGQLPGAGRCRSDALQHTPIRSDPGWSGAWLHVSEGAASGGDGSPDRPFSTIGEALAASPPDAAHIWVLPGTYDGVILDRWTALEGGCAFCADAVVLRAPDPSAPVIGALPGVERVSLANVRLQGGSVGLDLQGVAEVATFGLELSDVGQGIVLADAVTPDGTRYAASASATLRTTVIRRVAGAGFVAYGVGSLFVSGLSVFDAGGAGVEIHPESMPPDGVAADGASPLWGYSEPPEATLEGLWVEAATGAGLLLEGVTATVSESLIRATRPNDFGEGRGIVARQRDVGSVPAALTLTHSIVEDSHDVALAVDNARADVSFSVLRGSWPEGTPMPPDGDATQSRRGCLGNGLRVRANRPRARPAEPDVRVTSSVIEQVRESAVHVEGALVDVERTLIRDVTAQCRGSFGDGVAVYSYDHSPAEATLRLSRLSRTARAPLAAFGGRTTADRVFAEAFGSPPERAPGAVFEATRSACRTAASTESCAAVEDGLAPALLGTLTCDDDTPEPCFTTCEMPFTAFITETDDPLPGYVRWLRGQDDVVSTVTGEDGCARFELPLTLTGTLARVETAHPDYVPGAGWTYFGTAGGTAPILGIVPTSFYNSQVVPTLIGLAAEPVDLRRGTPVGAYVCAPAPADQGDEPYRCGGRGLEGLEATLDPAGGAGPFYTRDNSIFPREGDGALTHMSADGVASFYNVPPGDYLMRFVYPADPQALRCVLEDARGNTTGLAGPEPNSVRVRVEPARANLGGVVYCTVE